MLPLLLIFRGSSFFGGLEVSLKVFNARPALSVSRFLLLYTPFPSLLLSLPSLQFGLRCAVYSQLMLFPQPSSATPHSRLNLPRLACLPIQFPLPLGPLLVPCLSICRCLFLDLFHRFARLFFVVSTLLHFLKFLCLLLRWSAHMPPIWLWLFLYASTSCPPFAPFLNLWPLLHRWQVVLHLRRRRRCFRAPCPFLFVSPVLLPPPSVSFCPPSRSLPSFARCCPPDPPVSSVSFRCPPPTPSLAPCALAAPTLFPSWPHSARVIPCCFSAKLACLLADSATQQLRGFTAHFFPAPASACHPPP